MSGDITKTTAPKTCERGPCRFTGDPETHPADAYQMGWGDGQKSMPGADALAKIASVEKQIRLAAYASAGNSARADDARMFAIWSGELQVALKGTGLV